MALSGIAFLLAPSSLPLIQIYLLSKNPERKCQIDFSSLILTLYTYISR